MRTLNEVLECIKHHQVSPEVLRLVLEIYELGYVEGTEFARKLLRLQLGIATKEDLK
jgi:EAL domain-containing protein (putative c-di-GMP-specific phosphodiesterase class I)